MTKLQLIEQRLLSVLAGFDGLLPSDELSDMRELCSAGEPGISLENFVTQLTEYEVKIRPEVAVELEALGREMGLDPRYWGWLKELVSSS
jgi:hypothetical protein